MLKTIEILVILAFCQRAFVLASPLLDEEQKARNELEGLGYKFQDGEMDELLSLKRMNLEDCRIVRKQIADKIAAKYKENSILENFVKTAMNRYDSMCESYTKSQVWKDKNKLDRLWKNIDVDRNSYAGTTGPKLTAGMASYLSMYCSDRECKSRFKTDDIIAATSKFFEDEFRLSCNNMEVLLPLYFLYSPESPTQRRASVFDGYGLLCREIFSGKADYMDAYKQWQNMMPMPSIHIWSKFIHRN